MSLWPACARWISNASSRIWSCQRAGSGVGQLDLGEHPLADQVEQLLLVGHVGVQRRGAGLQLLGDPPHAHRVEPFRVEHPQRRVDDRVLAERLAGRVAARLAWRPPRRRGDRPVSRRTSYLTRTPFERRTVFVQERTLFGRRSVTTTAHRRPPPPSPTDPPAYRWRWVALFVILAAEVMDLLDALVTTIAGPTHPRRPRRLGEPDPVARRRLHARHGGRPDHRRPARRPLRPQADVPRRRRRLRRRLAAVRARAEPGDAGRRPGSCRACSARSCCRRASA